MRGIARRVGSIVLTLLVASFLIFEAMHLAPGDPAVVLAGGPQKATPRNLSIIREQYHLNDPLPVQYWDWLTGVLHGDLGRSYHYGDTVANLIASRLDTTLLLVCYASVLFLIFGIGLGILSALRRGAIDSSVLVGTTFGHAVPPFVAGVVLIAVFGVGLGWFPVSGNGVGFASQIWHLTMPAIALAISATAIITRISRQTTLEQLAEDHVEVARYRGLSSGHTLRRHVLRNGISPVLTMSGIVMASMLAGTVIIEQVFGLSGIGKLLVDAINDNDMPVTQAVLVVMVVAYVLITTLTDALRAALDPRTRSARS